jgi:hypothetical protein
MQQPDAADGENGPTTSFRRRFQLTPSHKSYGGIKWRDKLSEPEAGLENTRTLNQGSEVSEMRMKINR